MAVSALLRGRWRSGNLVGEAKHALIVRVRPGHVRKDYMDSRRIDHLGVDGLGSPIYPPLIWKGHNHTPYQGLWVPTGDWMTLPNIQSANWTRTFQDDGSSTCTIVMDDIAFVEHTGVAGLYHAIERGYFSPARGVKVINRPQLWANTGWTNVLNGGYQVELWEGYGSGDEIVPLAAPDPDTHSCQPDGGAINRTWTGLIDSCELESHPDHVTITARCFNILLTDQRLMGWNKARECQSPITFADRKRTQGEKKLSGPYKKSSGTIRERTWRSVGHDDPDHFEWVEIVLPKGYYTEFFLAPTWSGHEMWVSLYLNGAGTQDRVHPFGPGWVDLDQGSVQGNPFMRHWKTVSDKPRRWDLGHSWSVPNGSRLRITFKRLQSDAGDGQYKAGFDDFAAYRFGTDPEHPAGGVASQGKCLHWILVEDAAEVVRMLLIWAGFKEWHVEDFGWSLVNPLHYGEDKFFVDVLNEILAQGNYIFYMGAPTNDDRSIGVPHFEYQKVTPRPPAGTLEVRDRNLLEAAQMKWDLSNLPYVLRYRGEVSEEHGHVLFQDRTKQYMSSYYPPWSGEHYMRLGLNVLARGEADAINRVAGVGRHFTETLGIGTTVGLSSDAECLFACLLAAIQYALAMCTGQVQIPGFPGFDLNQQVSVVDQGAGINSRMWLASIESQHQLGEQGKWTMTLSGAYIDTQDMDLIRSDYAVAYKRALTFRPPTAENKWAQGPDGQDVVLS